MPWHMILLVLGLVCFLLAAFNVNPPKVSIGWLGAFFVGISMFFV